jgi:hypothetical protein
MTRSSVMLEPCNFYKFKTKICAFDKSRQRNAVLFRGAAVTKINNKAVMPPNHSIATAKNIT